MIENLLIGVVSGFIASLLFVSFLYRLRPKIVISPEIAKEVQSDGQWHYTFKVVNKTPYPVIDFKLELILLTPGNLPNGVCSHAQVLSTAERFELESGKNAAPNFDNELLFAYRGPLDQQWNDNAQQIMLAVISKHSLSQFSRVVTQKYFRKAACIKTGQFPTGQSLAVVTNG